MFRNLSWLLKKRYIVQMNIFTKNPDGSCCLSFFSIKAMCVCIILGVNCSFFFFNSL